MAQPKVFEFAKTIGMETLSLMDKLREWKIPVKSHMAELDDDTVNIIRAKLSEESSKKETPKKTVKKAAPKTDAAVKSTAKKATPKKAAVEADAGAKKTATRKTAAKAATGASRVVLRKASDVVAPPKEEAEVSHAPETHEVHAEEMAPVERTQVHAESPAASVAQQAQAPAPAAEIEVPAPAAPAPVTTSTEKVAAAPAGTSTVARPGPTIEPPKPPRSVKREVVIGSGPRPTPSNIVGRIDLNRARENRPMRPQSTGPRNIRPGFVAPPQPNVFTDVDHRKEDRRKKQHRPGTTDEAGVVRALEEEQEQFSATEFRKREMVFQPRKKKGVLARPSLKTEITTPKAQKRVVKIHGSIKVLEFAKEMGVKASQIIGNLMKQGIMVTQNDVLDYDTAALLAPDFGYEVENIEKSSADLTTEVAFGDLNAEPLPRPPVVTVMGHVDHGKTSLLDAIRKADVASGEAGGITQHIGAYQVTLEGGHAVTFIDTPGHEAFTAMRARGANVTDIVVLVVAADDGVMNQTIEAINHAKNAKVPIIVAVNKVDKPSANVQKIKQQLTEYELVAEEWGGTTIFCEVSALKKTGIKELLEQLHVQAEIMELKANPKRSATGTVIESRLERGRGVVATVLVKDGTMKLGQYICAGSTYGRVRAMFDDKGKAIKEAGPSTPCEVLGLNDTPKAGDIFDICKDEEAAQALAQKRFEESTAKSTDTPKAKVTLEELFSKVQTGDTKELPLVIKTDVAGSGEALKGLLEKASTDKVKVKIIHNAVGGINDSDVLLASSGKGLIIGFNVRPETSAAALAKAQGVEIKCYSIIYDVVDDVKKAMSGLLAPTIVEKTLGRAEVRNTFSIPKVGTIAGCAVLDGKITRSNLVRLLRDSRVIYEGKLSSLKRFKDDVREVVQGYECGIGIENYNDLKVGDVIEAFEKQSIAAEL